MRKIFLAIFLVGAALPALALEPGDRPHTAGPEPTPEEIREIVRQVAEQRAEQMRRERREKERCQVKELIEGPGEYPSECS